MFAFLKNFHIWIITGSIIYILCLYLVARHTCALWSNLNKKQDNQYKKILRNNFQEYLKVMISEMIDIL